MTGRESVQSYSVAEEIVHVLTHGLCALLSIAGLVALVSVAITTRSVLCIVGATIFGTTLVTMYSLSALYHSVSSVRSKRLLRLLDHASIYLLIAGTYTPFTLISLRGAWGWTLLAAIWGLAALGVLFKLRALGRYPRFSVVFYIAMGWLGLLAIKPLINSLATGGFVLLILGGITYSAGVGFYASNRPYHHAIWHLFVLTGSALHFFAVLLYVLPQAA
ncbi:MAG: hemolysin III family protein [Acidobacteriota bacterium]|nr:MAG: hemolysin III family protein [Acidobacteriota bacterium]